MKVLFVNQGLSQCGVYQFGKNTAFILSKFQDLHQFDYIETDNQIDISEDYQAVILNHHPCTMGWLSNDFFQKDIHYSVIMHDTRVSFPKAVILHPDPTFTNCYPDYRVGRPIVDFGITPKKTDGVVIGSFGFGFDHKGFEEILHRTNEEFDEAKIRIHIPFNTKVDPAGHYALRMSRKLHKIPLKDGIKLEVTHDYKNEEELVKWLSENSINIFLYKNTDKISAGCSSTTDWAIAAKKPLMVSTDPMFRHITSVEPEQRQSTN
jgi:hypothetical protein